MIDADEYLAGVLDSLSLDALAAKARGGMYNPRKSPYDQPTDRLIYDLGFAAGSCPDGERARKIMDFANGIISGDLDTEERRAIAMALLPKMRKQ